MNVDGTVVVCAQLEAGEPQRMVKVTLEDPREYEAAAKAHVEGTPVEVVGVLKKEGRSLHLAQPSGFRALSEAII